MPITLSFWFFANRERFRSCRNACKDRRESFTTPKIRATTTDVVRQLAKLVQLPSAGVQRATKVVQEALAKSKIVSEEGRLRWCGLSKHYALPKAVLNYLIAGIGDYESRQRDKSDEGQSCSFLWSVSGYGI
jgi:hypothetical protein